MRIFVALTVLLISVSSHSSQSSSSGSVKPTLIDEFGRLSCCCEIGARLDNFLQTVAQSPDNTGYIVISEPADSHATWRERYFDGYARLQGFEDRVTIVRDSSKSQPLNAQLWVLPPGAFMDAASFSRPDSYRLNAVKRKVHFYSAMGNDDLCATVAPIRLLAKHLEANEGWNANIAIGAESRKQFETERKKIEKRFETNYRIDSSRLRFFRAQGKFYELAYEIWLVRRK